MKDFIDYSKIDQMKDVIERDVSDCMSDLKMRKDQY